MTVQQNVEFGLDMRGVGREERSDERDPCSISSA